ncbi:murein biosynthesis integral membrane protein MurJ [Phosphitispora fastidiosa]|uniref:murein biosynthesis integral membrane protein MurJ n=1 Tax=Phosphitispora fastidiosa TaxID=2837202 RepID=UPI001E5BCDF1|nr:murein biosynthesis integral membrane protein MurJ [Phosphitispora fastidiosa]MBU7005913.1 putative peptidoglycan lipid II flippase [Phosphitispora fastidiosa]
MSTGKKVAQAAGILMLAMMLSRVLGYVREAVLASSFGASWQTDAFLAAFTIPDLFYDLLVGGILSAAFIPVFSGYLATDREEEAWEIASTMINLTVLLMAVCIVFGMVFAVPLTKLVAYNFSGETLELAVSLTRIMFPAFVILALNGLIMGILNSYKHFAAPAIGSVAYNFFIILFGLLFAKQWGIMAFAVGVVVGHVANLVIQLPVLYKMGLRYKFTLNLRHPGVRKMLILMLPAMLGMAANRVNLIVNQTIASTINEGSITALRLANRLMWLPLGVFAGSIAVAVFPTMTSQAARREMTDFKNTLSMGLRSIFLVIIPASVGLAVLSEPIIRMLFERGEFTHGATKLTAYALVFYCVGLFAQAAIWIITRAFYAFQDTLRPVLIAISTIVINIALNLLLRPVMAERGLALAFSLTGIYNMVLLLYFLRRKIGPIDLRKTTRSFFLILGSSAVMGVVAYAVAYYLGTFLDLQDASNQLIQVGVSIGAGLVVYVVAILLCRLEETQVIINLLRRKFKKV